jgi:hypothetical protein
VRHVFYIFSLYGHVMIFSLYKFAYLVERLIFFLLKLRRMYLVFYCLTLFLLIILASFRTGKYHGMHLLSIEAETNIPYSLPPISTGYRAPK